MVIRWNINKGIYWGMNFIWWFIWILLLIWLFATPWYFPGRQRKKDTAMDILNERLAKGEIEKAEFAKKRNLIRQNQ